VVTDQQVRRLMRYLKDGNPLIRAAVRTGMSEPTARKYARSGAMPSRVRVAHTWRTRPHPYEKVWSEVEAWLKQDAGLERKTIWTALNERHAGQFSVAQLRTLPRRVHAWRVKSGPLERCFFPPGASPRRAGAVGFHGYARACDPDRRRTLRTSSVPLRADLFELGSGDDLPERELRVLRSFSPAHPKKSTDLATRYARGPHSVWPLAVVFAALRLRRRTGKAPERFRMEKRRSASEGAQVIIVEGDGPKEMIVRDERNS
jgi:hypothetical protein